MRTAHAKILRRTDEHLRLMEDVLTLHGTETKSDVEAVELRDIQRLCCNNA